MARLREPPDSNGQIRPVNTLASPAKPSFQSPYKSAMAIHRRNPDDSELPRDTSPSPHLGRKSVVDGSTLDLGDSSDLFEEIENPLYTAAKNKGGPSTSSISQPVGRTGFNVSTNSLPQFGQPSPLRNPLQKKDKYAHLFNVPKKNVPRPEHHRVRPNFNPPAPPPSQAQSLSTNSMAGSAAAPIELPDSPSFAEIPRPKNFASSRGPADYPVPISRPANAPIHNIPQTPRTKFSSKLQGVPVNTPQWQPVNNLTKLLSNQNAVDLTERDDDDEFDPNAALRDNDAFGAPDPYMYVESGQAHENVKALLEGAFEDDEDQPRRRLPRRKKPEQNPTEDDAAKSLAAKLEALEIKNEKPAEDEKKEEEEDEEDGHVDGLKVQLLPHQVDGVSWMIDKEAGQRKKNGVLPKGGILADDMGLGKTIQTLALILSNPRPSEEEWSKDKKRKIAASVGKGTLVVAPLALIKQWESEINTKVTKSHQLRVLVHHGQSRTKRAKDLEKYDVVITTYQIMASEHASSSDSPDGPKIGCFGVHWYRIVLDEAHTIKNRNAKMTQACYALRSHYRWCLTGTPMQNNLDELQSLIRFLQIKPYNDLKNWKDQIMVPMKNGRGGLAMKRLQYFLKAFMKRRTKDILKKEGALNPGGKPREGQENPQFKIVARDVEIVQCEFDDKERRFYNNLASRAQDRLAEIMGAEKTDYIGALVLLLRLRQACDHWELATYSVTKDKDALTTGSTSNTQGGSQGSSRTKANNGGDMDDLAAMLGGLSVKQEQRCNVCSSALSQAETAAGALRCSACEEDLSVMGSVLGGAHEKKKKKKKKHGKKERKEKSELSEQYDSPSRSAKAARSRRAIIDSDDEGEEDSPPKARMMKSGEIRRGRRAILDSDDEEEEEEGSWIVPESARDSLKLGKAGGTDDENAEGGGEWLNSEDEESENDDQDNSGISGPRKHHSFISYDEETGDDEEGTTEDDDEDNEDTEDGSESDDSDSMPEPVVFNKNRRHVKKQTLLTPSTKIRKLIEILRNETPDHKVIVFSQFTSMLDIIEPFLADEGFKFARYDGGMRNDLREASLQQLRNDKGTRVLLCSLKCGSLGLNLTVASRVVILEPFWNPFVEEQAIDRVHRINQTVDVRIYRLTIAQTVEERILDLQDAKRKLAAAAIEGGSKAIAKLSMRDILQLFKREAEWDNRFEDKNGQSDLFSRGKVLNGQIAEIAGDFNDRNSTERMLQGATRMVKRRPEKEKTNEHPVWGRR